MGHTKAASQRPNIIMVITDDQDIDTLQLMPNVLDLASQGTTFKNAFVSNALCCPSRTTILTGLLSHSSGVYTNEDDLNGGFYGFTANGNETRTLAYILDGNNDEGIDYNTGLFGKYLNYYPGPRHADSYPTDYVPAGWDEWDAFTGSADGGSYYDYTLIHKSTDTTVSFETHGTDPTDYSTNVIGDDAVTWLADQDERTPFLLYFAPFAPHSGTFPAPGDEDVKAPRSFTTPAYDEADVSDKPPYIQALARLGPDRKESIQIHYDHQYGTLVDVDRYVGMFKQALTPSQVDNTVFIFMSDNGKTWGDHRWTFKIVPYERSIHVPLIVSGAFSSQPRGDSHLVTNADLVPTILQLTSITPSVPNALPLDGDSLVPLLGGGGEWNPRREILLEHMNYPTGTYTGPFNVPSFCGVRGVRWKYIAYIDGFEELYDLKDDPNELTNVVSARSAVVGRMRGETERLCDPLPPGFPRDFWATLRT